MIVHFKSVEHKYLSNFYMTPVEYEGVIYPSSEHAYMSTKSNEEVEIDGSVHNWKEWCSRIENKPSKVKGESRFVTLPDNWNQIKVEIMYTCLVSKFKNPQLREWLVATGEQNIQEGNFHNDLFWGVDLKSNPNVGENNLGRLLMRVRDEIKKGLH